MKSSTEIIALDFGNSRVKIFDGTNIKAIAYHPVWQEELLKEMLAYGNPTIGYSSVNKEKSESFIGRILSKSLTCIDLSEKCDEVLVSEKSVQGVGVDRVMGIIAAVYRGHVSCITVDCGTAITINALVNNRLKGGAIMPGLQTQYTALHTATSKLPLLQYKKQGNEIKVHATGTTTKKAMEAGVLLGITGAILHIVKNLEQEQEKQNMKLLITGGDGEVITNLLNNERKAEYIPTLVLEGIWHSTKRIVNPNHQ